MEQLELIHEMRRRWGNDLNEMLVSVKFSQTKDVAAIELSFEDPSGEIRTESTNLDFITDNPEVSDEPLFKPQNDVVDNAREFIELGGYSFINCFANLFTEVAANRINEQHQNSLSNKF